MFRHLLFIAITFLIAFQVRSQEQLKWKFKTGDKIFGSAVVDETSVFIGSGDGYMYALDPITGKEKWKFKTKGSIQSTPVLVSDKIVFNSFDGNVYCLDKFSGKETWKFKTQGEKKYDTWDYHLSSPVFDNEAIYIGSGDTHIYAINVKDGSLKWKYKTDDVVHATPALNDGVLYIGSFDGNFYSLDAGSGTLKWKFKTIGDKYFPKGEVQQGALLKDSVLYFGSRDYNIYAINARTGRGHWNMKEYGSWIIATPMIQNGLVYFGTSDTHRFYAVEEDYGKVKWTLDLNMRVYGSAVAFNDRIYFGCFNGKLYGVNANSGKIEWTFQTEGSSKNYSTVYDEQDHFKKDFELYGNEMDKSENMILSLGSILSTPVIKNNIIYFGSTDGFVYAVRL